MRKSIIQIAEIIQIHYGKVFVTSFLIWMVLTAGVFASKSISISYLIAAPVVFFVIFELTLNFILYAAYGSHYRSSIFGYFLVDHPVYGNTLRKDSHAKKLIFFIFDKYLFPYKAGRILDLRKNIELRNDININTLGFRGKEFDPNNKTTKLRIFCSGGSTTACSNVDDNETWPYYLEQCLRIKGYDAEVINAGVFRWVSYQESLRFRDEISKYNADIVLFNQGLNDEFEFSCLFPQKTWKPKTILNERETRNFYSGHHPILSNPRFLTIFLAAQSFFRSFYFARNMKFTNPNRWRNFLRNDYILAWFDNMTDIASIAAKRGILLYNVGYPLLVDMSDSDEERNTYIANSRLEPLHADYQAASKNKILRTLQTVSKIIPALNPDESVLDNYKNMNRVGLFTDELHMTAKGNRIFAESLCEKLIADPAFQAREQGHEYTEQKSNVNFNSNLVQDAKEILQSNSPFLERTIKEKIRMLENKSGKKYTSKVPEDQYTTF